MIKTDANGNKEWDTTYGGPGYEKGHYGWMQTSDNGYIICGYTDSYGAGKEDLWIIKTDASGAMEWNKTFGEPTRDLFNDMDMTPDGGYVCCGTYNAYGFSGDRNDIWVIKTDSEGNAQFSQTYGGSKGEWGGSVCTTSDGGCIAAGSTKSKGSGNADGWLIKIPAFTNNRPDKPTKPSGPTKGKPDTAYTFTTSTTDPDGDQVAYLWDWGDGNFSEWLGPYDPGADCEASYTWTGEDNYRIRVMARDSLGGESDWSEPLLFNTPKTKPFLTPIQQFLEQHPYLFLILRHLFGL